MFLKKIARGVLLYVTMGIQYPITPLLFSTSYSGHCERKPYFLSNLTVEYFLIATVYWVANLRYLHLTGTSLVYKPRHNHDWFFVLDEGFPHRVLKSHYQLMKLVQAAKSDKTYFFLFPFKESADQLKLANNGLIGPIIVFLTIISQSNS